ncbi:hypothetical protein A8L34_28145 [Bacillus sp. FJAT-27264]|uniref:hypothetical protein n=1 Tax=Paenibacillus sp. (strain DSM 101736 / FJAT-27264) TaxID=1850362 RepID=UPI000807FD2E|nr:hypothetical protein [Bacillus sp. FJAT-27264]OBZ15920.1 hypothetical protein A8L34_28145 [Bacillus sp. FJAT-27264]
MELENRYQQLIGNSSIFTSIFRKKSIEIRITLDWYQYLRAEAFIEDILELAGANIGFTITDLVGLLFEDFLYQVRSGVDLKLLGQKLIEKRNLLEAKRSTEDLMQVDVNHWSLRSRPNDISEVEIRIRYARKSVLRGEILLQDIDQIFRTKIITFEELNIILLNDFVDEIKKGNQAAAIKKILRRLRDQRA